MALSERWRRRFFTFGSSAEPVSLRSGVRLDALTLAYETYGELNEKADNAILLFHALTGSQHAAGFNPQVEGLGELWNSECQLGWWELFVGSGKALDTDRYFVVCANYFGGCYGSSGPTSTEAATGRQYRHRFPRVTLADIVDTQVRLLDHLGIGKLRAAIGNSTGGLCSLSLATRHPERVERVVPAASGLETTPLHRAYNFEQIVAIQSDPGVCRRRLRARRGPRRRAHPGAHDQPQVFRFTGGAGTALTHRSERAGSGRWLVPGRPSSRVLHAAPGLQTTAALRRQCLSAHPRCLADFRSARRRR